MPDYTTCGLYRADIDKCHLYDSYCHVKEGTEPIENCGYIPGCPVCGYPLLDKKWHSKNRCADAQQL